jgi:CRP/FNR family cyclic AMP-dependent transcriptional regulator
MATRTPERSPQGLLATVPLFAHLAPDELEALARHLQVRHLVAGTPVFRRGDAGEALYIVRNGEVRISVASAEGKELVLAMLGPGDFFGELALFDGDPRSADAIAAEDTTLLVLWRDQFRRLLEASPALAASALAALSRRLRRSDLLIEDLAFLDVRARLARVLLDLAARKGVPGPEGVVIAARLTQRDLAALVGATRESVNKWLRACERDGLVRRARGRLVLPDVGGLHALLRQ